MTIPFFPSEIIGPDAECFPFDHVSKQLSAFHEGPLHLAPSPPERIYRFTWIRSFHPAIVISVEFGPHLPAVIRIKRGMRDSVLPAFFRTECRSWELPDEQAHSLALTYKTAEFGSLPVVVPSRGISLDGADWLVEAREPGFYHLAHRHSPTEGGVYCIGREFLRIARLDYEEIY